LSVPITGEDQISPPVIESHLISLEFVPWYGLRPVCLRSCINICAVDELLLMLRVIKKVARIGKCLVINTLLMFKMENFILSPFVAEISVYVSINVYDLFEPYT
jgi:hypothetical protein